MADNTATAFFTTDGSPATGLLPTIRIWDLDSSMLVVNDDIMTEIGGGFYKYDFAGFDPLKDYVIRADGGILQPNTERFVAGTNTITQEEIADTVWEEPLNEHLSAGSAASAIDSVDTLIATLIKFENNRTKIDPFAKTLTVFDDDGITPIQVFNLLDDISAPSVTVVAERVPTL